MENGPFEDVFPIENGGYSIAMLVYLRVCFPSISVHWGVQLQPEPVGFNRSFAVDSSSEAVFCHHVQLLTGMRNGRSTDEARCLLCFVGKTRAFFLS